MTVMEKRDLGTVSDLGSIKRAAKVWVTVENCSGDRCVVSTQVGTHQVMSNQAHAPGQQGWALVRNDAGTHTMFKFTPQAEQTLLGPVESVMLLQEPEGKFAKINGDLYPTENCEQGQVAYGNKSQATCP